MYNQDTLCLMFCFIASLPVFLSERPKAMAALNPNLYISVARKKVANHQNTPGYLKNFKLGLTMVVSIISQRPQSSYNLW